MYARDTSPEAERVMLGALRRMRPENRLALGFQLTEFVRRLALSGVRTRHPGASEEEVCERFLRLVLGESQADLVIAARRERERRRRGDGPPDGNSQR